MCKAERCDIVCPKKELLDACHCDSSKSLIDCSKHFNDSEVWVVPHVKSLEQLSIWERSYEVIDLKNVRPRIVRLFNNKRLTEIVNLAETITNLTLFGNDNLSIDSILNSSLPCLNSFQLQTYQFKSSLSAGHMCQWSENLEHLYIRESNLTTIEANTFACMENLNDINLSSNLIDTIEGSLVFNTNREINIDLSANTVTSDQLAKSGLERNSVKVNVYICNNRISDLNETQFKDIVDNGNITMHLGGNPIDWTDDRHYWIFNNANYNSRILSTC